MCVFVCTASEPACLCTDNLTNTMRSVLPLSIYGCGWSVGGFLCKVSLRSVQEDSLNMRQRKICFFNTNKPFYLKNQFVFECHVYILAILHFVPQNLGITTPLYTSYISQRPVRHTNN